MVDKAQRFVEVFNKLTPNFFPFEDRLIKTKSEPDKVSYETHHILENGQNLYFGGVHIKKNYVSYHLMTVYLFPELLSDISPNLKKRMQGKSCFNFTKVDEGLFAELAELTNRCYLTYKDNHYL